MNNFSIIDNFLSAFMTYIDSGFGLLKGDVGHLTSLLIALDVTIAGLFWALDGDSHVLASLIRKVLFIGAFAYILNNFSSLAGLIFQSFTRLGLDASANTLAAGDLLKPGKLAGLGFTAAAPLLDQVSQLSSLDIMGSNLLISLLLLLAWFLVLLSFFILAIQVFITLVEFKLTSLAGFILVPFAFWNRTAFLAERVLGNVMSSGVKIMVLAVILGIGSTLFSQFSAGLPSGDMDIAQAASLILASLTLLGLGIFGPAIASGLISGGPQLAAGSALATVGAAAGAGMLASSAVLGAARLLTGSSGLATAAASTSIPPQGRGGSGYGPHVSRATETGNGPDSHKGQKASAGEGRSAETKPSEMSVTSEPEWASRLRRAQQQRGHCQAAHSAITSGDRPVAGLAPDISLSNTPQKE